MKHTRSIISNSINSQTLDKFVNSENGQAIVETLIVFPIIIIFILIIMEVAMLYNAKQVMNYAAFCAARTASVYGIDQPEDSTRIRRSAAIALTCISSPLSSELAGIISGLFNIPPNIMQTIPLPSTVGTPLEYLDRFLDAYVRTKLDSMRVRGDGRKNISVYLTYYYRCRVFPIGKLLGRTSFDDYLIELGRIPQLAPLVKFFKGIKHYNIPIRVVGKMDYWAD
ncbi:MAG: TadE/TadG family type IV pilus assembly protein [candidate division WOR-3 bacterium]